MEQPHLSSQLDYLEQKYQQTQASIAKLQQRIETQAYELQEQTHQIQQLEEELAQAKIQLTRLPQIDEQLVRFKDELLQIIEQQHSRHQSTGSDFGNNLMMQQLDNHTQTLNQLRREVQKTQRYDDQISLARAEATRLNKEVSKLQANLDNLNKQLDDRVKPLTYLEEQRRTDTRLLAELQTELSDLHKKTGTGLTKVHLIEQKIPQFAKYEAALDSMREDIRRHREHMDFQVAQRERQLKNWTELAEATEHRMRENESLMEKYAEHYQLNKRALASLQDFQERLQREQHRFGELQRLAEERQRTELEKFRADYGQRWNKQSMELQPQFADLQKSMEALQQRMNELTKLSQTIEDQMNLVLQIIEEDIQARALAATNWQERFEELANGQA
jgi:chromosome segregation ATPase